MLRKTIGKCQSLWSEFQRREDGQVAVMFALAILPLAAGAGAALDYSRGNQVRTSLQKALDSAVLAAAIDGTSNWRTAALNSFNGNANAKGSAAGTPTFTLEKDIYSGSVSAVAETSFMGVVGIHTLEIGARSAATTAKIPLCVLALNAFDTGAFDMNGNSKFNAPTCAVQANTKANRGMTQEGKPTAVAKRFGVSGAHTGTDYSPPPKDGSAAVADPYAGIPFPAYDACAAKVGKGLDINGGTTTLSPGTYCGGVRLKGGAAVTLQPGIYVMVDGSFWLDGGSSATGKEVVIAFTGDDATLRLWGDSTLDLTSPTSGTYKNFQFFQNPNDDKGRGAWVSIGGNGNTGDKSKATWDGIAYFPTQNFWVFGNTVVNMNSPSMSLVAGQVWVQGNATMNVTNDNPRNVSVTPVTTAGGARLIQ
jgi:Flp pilus assembly protein TadG